MQTYTRVIDEIDALFGAPDGHPASHSINVCLAVYGHLLKMSKERERVWMLNFDPTTKRCMKTLDSVIGSRRTDSYTDSRDGPTVDLSSHCRDNEATAASVS